jgi:hypothetical protein
MTTIKEFLIDKKLKNHVTRFWKLRSIKAPRIILKGELSIIRRLQKNELKIRGIDEFGSCELVKDELVTGRSGKKHRKIWLADGRIIGVFNGNYNNFIKIWEDKKINPGS